LEYLLAEAQQGGARKVATFGGLQSNHARLTAAAARRLGMEPHLFYFERRPSQLKGNLFLNDLFGAKMHFIPFGGGGDANMTIETTTRLVRLIAWLAGIHGVAAWVTCAPRLNSISKHAQRDSVMLML
jgi:1-aminocyclopropane-1-carboxylate deaminase/D-cysteine desulfhydrase-like pyridoxal-dependent ACC family enzyme